MLNVIPRIYLGGYNKVIVLDINGSRVREVQTDGGFSYGLFYNEMNDQMVLRQNGRVCYIPLDKLNDNYK
jgi:hypothetical protein